MLHLAFEHIGDGLDAAMGMPGEALDVVLGDVAAEIIEQQERVGHRRIVETEGALKMHTGTFEVRHGGGLVTDWPDGHGSLLKIVAG
jgi:hypothetical protein